MEKRTLFGALSAAAIAVAGLAFDPVVTAPKTSNWPLCGAFSLFSKDECAAIKYCVNTNDPACQQAGTQPSTVPPQQRTP